jgi:hypothetical protein
MNTEIDIKKLAMKHKLIAKESNAFDDALLSSIRAFANEYMALSSSEPIGVIVDSSYVTLAANFKEIKIEEKGIDYYQENFKEATIGAGVYLANPINQQLQTERDECVAEIRRLRLALKQITSYRNTSNEKIITEALTGNASILKLLEK